MDILRYSLECSDRWRTPAVGYQVETEWKSGRSDECIWLEFMTCAFGRRKEAIMLINNSRSYLRDFEPADRTAFVAYQMDPRYRRLYDLDDDPTRANELFDLFASWRMENPRRNFQLGIFDTSTDRLCGCGGLRLRPEDHETAVLGIELAPSDWGRYRIALDAISYLLEYGFEILRLRMIVGDTASGNERVEKLARWFGARIIDQRDGPQWMRARGWHEVDWALTQEEWHHSSHHRRRRAMSVLEIAGKHKP